MEQTAQLLFEYLRDILYHPERATLDLTQLPEAFQKLGQGMRFLAACVQESRTFSRALANGDLSCTPPDGNNVLAAPVKALQGSLRHLAWQTQQIAKGDYGQRVDFMGEFSDAFNSMTQQLRDRTAGLIAEKERVERKNQELRQILELVLALTNYTHNMIFVFSVETERQIFVNQAAEWMMKANPTVAAELRHRLNEHIKNSINESEEWETEADFGGSKGVCFYDVESFHIVWEGEPAVGHILADNTERKKRERMIYSLAYIDPLTGLNNRRYAMDQMNNWMRQGIPFLLTFLDVDYLKYCNDKYGHSCGDHYLETVASLLQSLGGELCRVGGDEFLLLQPGGEDPAEQDRRIEQCRTLLLSQTDTPYPKSFSYATSAVPAGSTTALEEYIKAADEKMYQYKLQYKKPLGAAAGYHDDRL